MDFLEGQGIDNTVPYSAQGSPSDITRIDRPITTTQSIAAKGLV